MTWKVRSHGLGRTLVCSGALTLDLMDGGGHCASLAVWRIGRIVLCVVKASRC
jgi:hypothetical protein